MQLVAPVKRSNVVKVRNAMGKLFVKKPGLTSEELRQRVIELSAAPLNLTVDRRRASA